MILSQLAFQPVAFDSPENGSAKAINTGIMNFSKGAVIFDPTQSNQLLEVKNIQGIFVDNYNSSATLVITVIGTGQVLRVPMKAQAFLPLIASDRPVIQFTCSDNAAAPQAWILNVPTSPLIWTLS